MKNLFLITDREGFTPHISRLISMMNYARRTTLDMVQGLKVEELDFLPSPDGNSIGMLVEHIAALEVDYQCTTFEKRDLNKTERLRWKAGLELGKVGRKKLRGRELGYYLQMLQEVRDKTFSEFRIRDDEWLHQEFPSMGVIVNNYFLWFHVFEDELNHRGQIRLIRKQLPRFKNGGVLHLDFEPMTSEGKGLKIAEVWPKGVAARAGLQSSDIVIKLDGENTTDKVFDAIDVHGQAGESVRLKIKREGVIEPLEFELVREAVNNS